MCSDAFTYCCTYWGAFECLCNHLEPGYTRKKVVCTTCCLTMPETKSVSSCSERPHSKAEWKAGRPREGGDATLLKNGDNGCVTDNDGNSWAKNDKRELEREVQGPALLLPPHSWPVMARSERLCRIVNFGKLQKCNNVMPSEGWGGFRSYSSIRHGLLTEYTGPLSLEKKGMNYIATANLWTELNLHIKLLFWLLLKKNVNSWHIIIMYDCF